MKTIPSEGRKQPEDFLINANKKRVLNRANVEMLPTQCKVQDNMGKRRRYLVHWQKLGGNLQYHPSIHMCSPFISSEFGRKIGSSSMPTRFVGCPSKSVTNGKQRSFQLLLTQNLLVIAIV